MNSSLAVYRAPDATVAAGKRFPDGASAAERKTWASAWV